MTPSTGLKSLIPDTLIESRIFYVRGKKVMVDADLAVLYGVPTKRLNEQVQRNKDRFPDDFTFRLTEAEKNELVAFCDRFKGLKHSTLPPWAFTEQGVAMLSSVLKSEKAVQVNIQIMRTFTKIRELAASNELIRQKIEELEKKYDKHEAQFKVVFEAIRQLLEPPPAPPKRPIGFHA